AFGAQGPDDVAVVVVGSHGSHFAVGDVEAGAKAMALGAARDLGVARGQALRPDEARAAAMNDAKLSRETERITGREDQTVLVMHAPTVKELPRAEGGSLLGRDSRNVSHRVKFAASPLADLNTEDGLLSAIGDPNQVTAPGRGDGRSANQVNAQACN